MRIQQILPLIGLLLCTPKVPAKAGQPPRYEDVPYVQDYSVKHYLETDDLNSGKVFSSRNGVVQVLIGEELLKPDGGTLQYPGTLKPDMRYIGMQDKAVEDLSLYEGQFLYLDDTAVFSNAWAGTVYIPHGVSGAHMVTPGRKMQFIISNGHDIRLAGRSGTHWSARMDAPVLDIYFDEGQGRFIVLQKERISALAEEDGGLTVLLEGENFTCLTRYRDHLLVGTADGYLTIDPESGAVETPLNGKLPWPEITCVTQIAGRAWFGSTRGAYMLRDDGTFNYYFGERWLPGDSVVHIAGAEDGTVHILTNKGLGTIHFREMTLYDKAMHYEQQVRERHIRYGIYTDVSRLNEQNELWSAQNRPAASDNLWTAMYLGSQMFRYLVTGDTDAQKNWQEAFEAMERLHTINGIEGLFGRSFERRGVMEIREEYRRYAEDYWYPDYARSVSWQHAEDKEWDWHGTASSDQTVGQMFALSLVAQHADEPEWRDRAVRLLDELMSYIVDNDLYLKDPDGRPTLWGRWNPEYVNRFEPVVGDRKVYSSNIIAFLQAAFHFTGKEKYRTVANELINEYGYLENLMYPMSGIGRVGEDADNWSKMLSNAWNHSDDEMYFLAYWQLYPFAFDDTLTTLYREAIRDHWEIERPEKDPLWNFCYAMTGADAFDLDESIWTLKEFPLDMIMWEMRNSHRKDLDFIQSNFRDQTTRNVLPPDERPYLKHNRNVFTLDQGNRHGELGGGDTYLLPYWMGRYLGVISAPSSKE
jgi:hypothetical protein